MRLHSTYHVDCLCGHAVESIERETKCEFCGRLLVFEWGGNHFQPATARIDTMEKPAAVILARAAKA